MEVYSDKNSNHTSPCRENCEHVWSIIVNTHRENVHKISVPYKAIFLIEHHVMFCRPVMEVLKKKHLFHPFIHRSQQFITAIRVHKKYSYLIRSIRLINRFTNGHLLSIVTENGQYTFVFLLLYLKIFRLQMQLMLGYRLNYHEINK